MRDMKQTLFQRREALLRLLGLGNKLHTVVRLLSQEFGCSQVAIYKDYNRMPQWADSFNHSDFLVHIFFARYNILTKEGFRIILDSSEKPALKLLAINTMLKTIQGEIGLAKQVGLLNKKTEVQVYPPMQMPFECDPQIKRLLLENCEEQRQQKEIRQQAMRAKALAAAGDIEKNQVTLEPKDEYAANFKPES